MSGRPLPPQFLDSLQWLMYVLLALLAALYFAWQILAHLNFLYPLWYEIIDIDHHIALYGPQNRYKHDFETTAREERLRLFAAIATAIHQQGKGLEALLYHRPDGQVIAPLLRPPEIQHLRDVARLIDVIKPAGWGAMIGWLALAGFSLWRRLPMPSAARLLGATLLALGGGAVIVVLAGPVPVFYALHEWVFPPGHPWFFYYEDSLMTTLLKAPDIFGCIAAAWACLSAVLLAGLLYGGGKLYACLLGSLPWTL